MDLFLNTGKLGRFSARLPDHLGGNRMIGGVPAVAGKQPHGGFPAQTAIVLAQRFEQIRAQHHIAIPAAFAALHVNYVAATVYIRDLQPGEFGAPEACRIEGHEQSALKGRGRGFDETVDFLSAEDGRKMDHLLRVRRQIRTPRLLQRPDVEETDSAQMLDDGVGLKLSFAEQIRLVLADVIRPELIRRAVEVARILVDSPEISSRCAGGVVSTLEFFEHQLLEMGHRDLLVTAPYRDSETAAVHP